MKKRKFLFSSLFVLLGVSILLIAITYNSGIIELSTRGDTEPYSITFNSNTNKIGSEPFKPLTFYSGTGEVKTGLNNSVQFDYKDFTNQPTSWQLIKVGGSFENIEPISGMTNMSITKADSNVHLGIYWSNSRTFNSSRYVEFNTATNLDVSTDFDDYLPNYIKVVILGTQNAIISSMRIEFTCLNHYPTVEVSSSNSSMGSVSGGGVYFAGSNVTLRATTYSGYQFIGWYEDDVLLSTQTLYSFVMPFYNRSIEGRFTFRSYNLVVISSDETKGSVIGSGTYSYNSEVVITATTFEGNEFLGWYSGETLISDDATYIFDMPHYDLSYVAKFVKKYIVSVYNVKEEWGSVSGEGDYGYTTTVTLTAIPNDGYYLRAWYDESFNVISRDLIYTFTMPEYDVAIYIDFKELEAVDNYYLGTYPQTKMTNSSLISTLNTLSGTLPTSSNSQSWTSYNYYVDGSNETDFMWYRDVSMGDELYRGVYFTSYRPYFTTYSSSANNSYQDDNGYSTNTRYWFKYEQVVWDVLSVNEAEGPLLLSNKILDSQEYYHSTSSRTIDGKTVYANNYKESNIRTFLNNNFYDTAFSIEEKSLIATTNVDNSVASTGYDSNPYACENTNDNMFLLSYEEVTNATYGFDSNVSRTRQATDYAKAMGVYVYSSNGNSFWWLRSPYYDRSFSARTVRDDGDFSSSYVSFTSDGLLPAFRINR